MLSSVWLTEDVGGNSHKSIHPAHQQQKQIPSHEIKIPEPFIEVDISQFYTPTSPESSELWTQDLLSSSIDPTNSFDVISKKPRLVTVRPKRIPRPITAAQRSSKESSSSAGLPTATTSIERDPLDTQGFMPLSNLGYLVEKDSIQRYLCAGCGAVYNQLGLLNKHLAQCLSSTRLSGAVSRPESVNRPETSSLEHGQFPCHNCNRVYVSKSSLNRHRRANCPGTRAAICDYEYHNVSRTLMSGVYMYEGTKIVESQESTENIAELEHSIKQEPQDWPDTPSPSMDIQRMSCVSDPLVIGSTPKRLLIQAPKSSSNTPTPTSTQDFSQKPIFILPKPSVSAPKSTNFQTKQFNLKKKSIPKLNSPISCASNFPSFGDKSTGLTMAQNTLSLSQASFVIDKSDPTSLKIFPKSLTPNLITAQSKSPRVTPVKHGSKQSSLKAANRSVTGMTSPSTFSLAPSLTVSSQIASSQQSSFTASSPGPLFVVTSYGGGQNITQPSEPKTRMRPLLPKKDWLAMLTKLPLTFHMLDPRSCGSSEGASGRGFNSKEKNFPCPKCPTGFSEKGSLTRHLRYECQQEPRFKCPYCNYRTKWTSSIYNHVRNKHEGQRVYCVDVRADEACMAGRRSMLTPTNIN
ncbi:hypothetical protein QAD02_022638 [Eretmocerus hayati]|uniref:Uncharacterized protein n=1 Tax=Eretmocerus hayati TaxID=131215 RepID=A0ACC2PTC9_9HYME|nr:hypothetical protein QAD02_022638 [Eretmocerus hayati]